MDIDIAKKALNSRILDLLNISKADVEKFDKEDLVIENAKLKQENEALKKRQVLQPQLVLKKETKKYAELEFINSKGISKKGKLNKITNQYSILAYFIRNRKVYLATDNLIPALRPIRGHVEEENPKKRVLDTIKELRDKFGEEVVLTEPHQGFLFYATVILPK